MRSRAACFAASSAGLEAREDVAQARLLGPVELALALLVALADALGVLLEQRLRGFGSGTLEVRPGMLRPSSFTAAIFTSSSW